MMRVLRVESLEERRLLAADGVDVNQDGNITASDVLAVANEINNPGQGHNGKSADVSGDGVVDEADAEIVQAVLNGDDIAAILAELESIRDELIAATARVDALIERLTNEPPETFDPDAVDDGFTIQEDAPHALYDVLANDVAGEDGETFELSEVGTPTQGGTASIIDGQLSYHPADGFFGFEEVAYSITDTGGQTDEALVTFDVEEAFEPVGNFLNGPVPADGHIFDGDADVPAASWIEPLLREGQRLEGTVEIDPKFGPYIGHDSPYRMLIDGEVIPDNILDTTQYADGTYAITAQFMGEVEPEGVSIQNIAQVVVINNSGTPYTGLEDHTVVQRGFYLNFSQATGTFGKVDVDPTPVEYRINTNAHNDEVHPRADTDALRYEIAENNRWWVDAYSGQGAWIGEDLPMLMKNRDGDFFVKRLRNGATPKPDFAQYSVDTYPAFDGHRGTHTVSGFTMLVGDDVVWGDADDKGWLGVDLSGRVTMFDITGTVRTIFGPRSVAGEIQTDNQLHDITLEDRMEVGEKEWVGTPFDVGRITDLSRYGDGTGRVLLADNEQGRVLVLDRDTQTIVEEISIPDVQSVWADGPDSFWAVVDAGTQYEPEGDSLWRYEGGTVTHIADIPKANMVRGDVERGTVYVFTLSRAIWQYTPATDELVQKYEGIVFESGGSPTVDNIFGAVDENGAIGPKGWIYTGGGTQPSQARVINTDAEEWIITGLGVDRTDIQNVTTGGSEQSRIQPFGSYPWSIAPHLELAKFLNTGSNDQTPWLWTAHLRQEQLNIPLPFGGGTEAQWRLGEQLFKFGKPDQMVGFNTVFGAGGHGLIGYSVEDLMPFNTWEDARPTAIALVEEVSGDYLSEDEKEAVGLYMFTQRTARHFVNPIL